MAALGFFRRRQKLVMIIMVLLMVAFLIPTGIRSCGQGNPAKQELGHVGNDKITVADKNMADRDIHILNLFRQNQPHTMAEQVLAVFLALNPEGARLTSTNWALLLYEARKLGLKTSKAQASQFLTDIGWEGPVLQRELGYLGREGLGESDLLAATGDLLLVTQSVLLNLREDLGSSLPELKHDFRDWREKLDLGMVTIPASAYMKDVPEPTGEQIQQQFENYKELTANSSENRTRFGFGYRAPDRLEIQYLAVNTSAVSQAIEPSEQQMLAVWQQSGQRIIVKAPASRPGTSPASQPAASEPTEEQTIVIERFSEAKPAIREQIRAQETERKTNDLLNRARALVVQFKVESNPYAKARETLLHSAEPLLARPVGPLRGSSLTLSELVDQLKEASGVQIVYPFGQHENFFLDGSVKVKVEPKWVGQTLGEVLNQVADAHKYPRLKWVTCDGLDNAIFPVDPIDGAPVMAGDTGLIDARQASQNPLLTQATLGGKGQQTLLGIAASTFSPLTGKNALVRKGDDFRDAMTLETPFRGKLIWRLAEAEPAHTPQSVTPEVRQQIVHDLKLVQALEKAEKAAEDLRAKAQKSGNLEQLAKAQNLEYTKTGWITRKIEPYPEMVPGMLEWSSIPGVGMDPQFTEMAFKLAPSDPDRIELAPTLVVAPLYRAEKVMVLQRLGYEPATQQEFERVGLNQLFPKQRMVRYQMEFRLWLSPNEIIRRIGYVGFGGKTETVED